MMKSRAFFICLLALMLDGCIFPCPARALTAEISINAPDPTMGSFHAVSVSVNNPDAVAVVDAYVAVKLPNAKLLFVKLNTASGAKTFVPGTLDPATWTPYLQGLRFKKGFNLSNFPLLQYQFTGQEASGAYVWFLAFTAAGTKNFAGTVGKTSFTFSATGAGTACNPDKIDMAPKVAGSLTDLTWKVTTTCPGPVSGIVCFEGGSESLCASNILDTDTPNSKSVTGLTSTFAVDFLLPSGAQKAKFLYCDSGTLSITTPHTCSDGSAPKVKTVTVSDKTSPPAGGTQNSGRITWKVTDKCSDGSAISYKFYDRGNNLVWPGSTTHYVTPSLNTVASRTLACVEAGKVCLGGKAGTRQWGVGFKGTGSCSNCCGTCDGKTYSLNLTCGTTTTGGGGNCPSFSDLCGPVGGGINSLGGSVIITCPCPSGTRDANQNFVQNGQTFRQCVCQ